jgi:hypothetical protein
MPQVSPFHVLTPEADDKSGESKQQDVFHTHTQCRVGRRILAWNKIFGTGGLARCAECDALGGGKRR